MIDNEAPRAPIKKFRVISAYGPYRKGDVIQPTGMYRDELLRRKVIELCADVAPARTNRQVNGGELFNRDAGQKPAHITAPQLGRGRKG